MRRVGAIDGLDAGESTRDRIEDALRGLSPEIADSGRWALENELFDDEADESILHDAPHEE